MKKFTLVAGLAAMLFMTNTNTAKAQLSIRPEIGGNMATLTGDIDDAKMIFGIKGGAYFKIPITSGLYVEPGILFSGKGAKQSSETSVPGAMSTKTEATTHLNYIEVPINIGYQFSFGGGYDDNGSGLFVYVGPYIGYGMGGKNKFENTTTISIPGFGDSTVSTSGDDKVKFGTGDDDMYKPLDFGVNIGAGYQFSFGLYVRAQYGLGLANIANSDDVKVHNNTISLAIGYSINLGGGGSGW